MKQRRLWCISVTTSSEAEEAVGELLGQLTGEPVSAYADAKTRRATVSAHCSRKPQRSPELKKNLRSGLKRIRDCGLDISPGRISLTKTRREAWTDSWKRHFRPLEIGSALLIKPSWSRRKPGSSQKLVVLDPGLSFGTGQHPTTLYCLCELVKQRPLPASSPKSFLDLGTGSGILAIAAARLGYSPVNAIDFDADAVRVARRNAQRNGVLQKIKITCKDLTQLSIQNTKQCNVICANLISMLLIEECDRILARLRKGGTLVLSGILDSEFLEVQRKYEKAGLKLVGSSVEKERRSGTFLR